MVPTLVIPGYRGSEKGHWQDHFLREQDNAHLVEQEDWDNPVLADWLHRLEAALMAHPRAILVGHSLGALLISHLHDRPAAAHVAGALIVAPADGARMARANALFASFGNIPDRQLPFPSILVASQNDPYMSFETAGHFAARWGSALIDLGHAGHINVASGHGRWPEAHVLAGSLAGREPSAATSPVTSTPWSASRPAERNPTAAKSGAGIFRPVSSRQRHATQSGSSF